MNLIKSGNLSALGVLLLSATFSMPALANIGSVLYTFGNVTVEKPAISILKRGAEVEQGDVVVTGPKGYAQIKLLDGTKIAIRPGSRFEIEAFEAPATATQPAIGDGKALRSSFKLQKGGFRTITGGIAKRDPTAYQVTTPSAVIRVRGTNFVTRTCSGDCGSGTPDGDYIGVSKGGVNVSNGAGSVDLSKNQFGFAQSFNTPPTRLTAPPSSLQDDGIGNLEAENEESSDEEASSSGGSEESSEESGESSSESGGSEGSGSESGEGGTTETVAATRSGTVSTTASTRTTSSTTTTTTRTPGSTEPTQEITGSGTGGQAVDLTGGDQTTVPRGLAFAVAGRAVGINTDDKTATFNANNNLTGFTESRATGQSSTFAIGAATNLNAGFDPNSSIRWGRWGGGIARQSNNGGAPANLDLTNQSLHWVAISATEVVPSRVITGSASYTLVGNTDPTNAAGNVGVLGSANFSADFTNATVQSSLQLGINQQNWTASGSGSITSNLFNGLYNTVTVNGVAGGNGSFGGAFGGYGATGVPAGAGMTYQLSNGSSTVSGAAVFNNSGSAQ